MNSSGLAEFETQLKVVVTSKRLSSSKMVALTELAVENMHLDTQMISLLYRTHKGLPTPNKISSLYVFDSIARAAYRTKSKKGLVADLNNSAGNAASFLIRLEGMLDGLVDDMLAHGPPEAKEKTRKVLDIWTREGTFPAGALKRLSERVSGSHADPQQPLVHQGAAVVQPQPHTPPTPATPSSAISSLPPAILALLGSAVPTQPPPPQQFKLDPTQLALISQLTAQSQSATPPFSPARNGTSLPTNPTGLTIQTTRSFSPTAPPYSPVRKDIHAPPGGAPSFERSRSQSPSPNAPRLNDKASLRDDRSSRQGDNGSRYKDQFGDDRTRHDDDRRTLRRFEDERSPRTTDPRTRDPRRRSRSPRRRAASPGRHVLSPGRRALSPPSRRPLSPVRGSARAPLPGAGDAGKDEFGRDLRGGSSERSPMQAQPQAPVQSYQTQTQSYPTQTPQSHPTQTQPPSFPPKQPSTPTQTQSGPETFDISTFNPANPASWANLAAAWETMNGRAPTQEEMMVFVMGGGAMGGGAMGGGDVGGGYVQGRGRGRGRGGFRGRGRGRGRGGFGGAYGEGYGGGGYGGGDAYAAGESDAVVLGGGDEEDTNGQGYGNGQAHGNEQGYGGQDMGGYDDTNPAPTNSSGGMKRIDGKWVWTKK